MATPKSTATKAKTDKPTAAAPAPVAKAAAPAPAAKPAAPAPAAKPAAKPATGKTAALPTEAEIKTRAYEIYVSEGCQDGHDQEYWLRAEAELRQRASR